MAVDADRPEGRVSEPDDPTQETSGEFGIDADEHADASGNGIGGGPVGGVRLAAIVGLLAVLVVGCLTGWLGYRAYHAHLEQQQRSLWLQVGRQAAVNLTTISYTEADADVARIVDSSTGAFRDDFQKRAPDFIQVVRLAVVLAMASPPGQPNAPPPRIPQHRSTTARTRTRGRQLK
jgi:Mce-associated membrane protein